MNKKEYSRPELSVVRYTLRDVLTGSPEYFSSYIDDGGDWGDPIIDPDDEILW